MPDPITPPRDDDEERPEPPEAAPETEHTEEQGDPLGANFA